MKGSKIEERKNKEGKKVGENDEPLRFRPPPRVTQASRLDQKLLHTYSCKQTTLTIFFSIIVRVMFPEPPLSSVGISSFKIINPQFINIS